MSEFKGKLFPDYEKPPVIEVVCGIQFKPLSNFRATTYGLFWQTIRDEYPKVEDMPPLPEVIEQFLPSTKRNEPQLEVLKKPPLPRVFFIHKDPVWLIQLQPDRFIHNWRKEGRDFYPRYPVVFNKFWNAWERFLEFVKKEGLDDPLINQLEISYINHIPMGEGWTSLADLGMIFSDFSWRCERRFLSNPESFGLRISFFLPDSQGRLHVSVKHAVRVADNHPVLLCELTARGMPKNEDFSSIKDWFNLGREWIVRGFADLINEKTQKEQWGRKR